MLMTMGGIADIVGIVGVALVLTAYCLIQTNKIDSDAMSFSVVNLIGSILILYSLFFHWNLASVIIEVAWITISIGGIIRVMRRRNAPSK